MMDPEIADAILLRDVFLETEKGREALKRLLAMTGFFSEECPRNMEQAVLRDFGHRLFRFMRITHEENLDWYLKACNDLPLTSATTNHEWEEL